MKFGKELVRSVEEHNPAWKKYAVDYKGMKRTLPKNQPEADDAPNPAKSEGSGDYSAFWEVFELVHVGNQHSRNERAFD
jgi:hypothetical protein